ncbi:MAG: hypothetical protein KDA89_12225, partial [Planctomycetaceae bacterium]|nr:hypothetical protein [Planctomycetaceae bacterium]
HRYADCEAVVRDLASLGIHNEVLSFIDGAAPTGIGSGLAPTMGVLGATGNTRPGPPEAQTRSGPPKTSREDAQAAKKKPRKGPLPWYVQYEDRKGNSAMDKFHTAKILELIEAGMLNAKARAKASADGTWLPLAQIPQFKDAVEAQLSRMALKKKHDDLKSLYKTVDRDQRRYNRWRWFKGKFRGAVGVVSLIIWLAVIGVVGLLAAVFGKTLWNYLGQTVTDMMG